MKLICPKCNAVNPPNSKFCNDCGVGFVAPIPAKEPPKKIKNDWLLLAVILLGSAILCGGVSIFSDLSKNSKSESSVSNSTPVPAPMTFAEIKIKANELLATNFDDVSDADVSQIDSVTKPLREIPKEDKNYKEAQAINKKIIDKVAPLIAEKVVLGDERPSEIELKLAFNHYLRTRLNDYDSSEYVDYSPAVKIKVKNEPFWLSVLRLRAKNAFGGYIVKDVKMYIRRKEVVLADGL